MSRFLGIHCSLQRHFSTDILLRCKDISDKIIGAGTGRAAASRTKLLGEQVIPNIVDRDSINYIW